MSAVVSWLEKQVDTNDPARAGMPGAVRLIEAAAALAGKPDRPTMVFGLMVEPDDARAAAPLVGRIRRILETFLPTLDTDDRRVLRDNVGTKLVALGLFAPKAPAVPTHHVVVRYPLMERCVYDEVADEERMPTAEELRCWNGVRPHSEMEPELDADWVLSSTMVLVHDDGRLWCELMLAASREPTESELAELRGPISRELWDSSWALHVEWDDERAHRLAGLSESERVNVQVHEEPVRIRVDAVR